MIGMCSLHPAANGIKQSVPDAAISYYAMNLMDMNAINENIERMEQDNIAFNVVICCAGLSYFGSDLKTAANGYEFMMLKHIGFNAKIILCKSLYFNVVHRAYNIRLCERRF